MFRLTKSLIRKCSTVPPSTTPPTSYINDLFYYALGGALGGGIVGGKAGYDYMKDSKILGSKFITIWTHTMVGGVLGAVCIITFPITLPILGVVIWDDYKKNK